MQWPAWPRSDRMKKPDSPELLASVETLQPVLEDRTLMALIKNRHVPFTFIIKRVHRRLTPENAAQVVQALKSLIHYGNHGSVLGIQDLGVHFLMVSDVLHVGGGRIAHRGGHATIEDVGPAEIKGALSPSSRLAGRVFGDRHYDKLKEKYDLYERVLKECERCTNLAEARKRVGLEEEDWQHLKSHMGRFGLVRDIVYAKAILLEGGLVREIEQRFLGQRVEDVVPRLLRDELAMSAH